MKLYGKVMFFIHPKRPIKRVFRSWAGRKWAKRFFIHIEDRTVKGFKVPGYLRLAQNRTSMSS